MLTAKQLLARNGKITASFAPYLMSGDSTRILNEWYRLLELPDYQEPDFSENWMVNAGSFIEPFALDWHERKSGAITRRGEVVNHPELPHVCCTLDGWRSADNAVIDCKYAGAYRKIEDICAFYTPQMVVQRGCAKASSASLLIIHGGVEPVECPLTIPLDYEAEVWSRIAAFWACVENLTPPCELPPVAAPVPQSQWRTVDMSGSNSWASYAADWLSTRTASQIFSKAEKELKALMEADIGRAFAFGVECKRAKNGSLRITEMKEKAA